MLALVALVLVASCSGGSKKKGGGNATPGALVGNVVIQPFVGTKKILFIVVKFNNAAPLFAETTEGENELKAVVNDVATALEMDSFGAITPVIEYTWPPLLIDRKYESYDPVSAHVEVRADAIAAARAAGWEPNDYDREVLFSMKVWPGAPARGWVRTAWMSNTISWVVVHELGHTLDRNHADFWDGDPALAGVMAAGKKVPYGDLFDPMGTGEVWSRFLHSGPWFKLRAGWMGEDDYQEVTESGDFTLSPLESPDGMIGPAALLVRRSAQFDFWIAHRSTEPLVADGLVILRTQRLPFLGTLLLDMNPGSMGPEVEDAALARGQVFDDSAESGITIENITPSENDPAQVRITLDSARQAALDTLPVIEILSPRRIDGPVGGVIEIEILAHDPDDGPTDGEGVRRVTLAVVEPSMDPSEILASQVFQSRPYKWTLDTVEAGLANSFHTLIVTVESMSGDSTEFIARLVIDNYSGSAPIRAGGVRTVALAVTDDAGVALRGSRIVVTTRGRERIALTDAAGIARFEFTDRFETLRFEGTVSAPGFLEREFVAHATGESRIWIANDFRPDVRASIVLDRPAEVSGTVVDSFGQTAANVRVSIAQEIHFAGETCTVGTEPTKTWEAVTDEYGVYQIRDLPAERALLWSLTDVDGKALVTKELSLTCAPNTRVARRDWQLAAPSRK